jgi:hypothetical protein
MWPTSASAPVRARARTPGSVGPHRVEQEDPATDADGHRDRQDEREPAAAGIHRERRASHERGDAGDAQHAEGRQMRLGDQ